MSGAFGQPWVIGNLPGAAGLLAPSMGSAGRLTGYSLVVLSGTAVTTLRAPAAGQNPARDLVPIAMIVSFPSVLGVNAKVPAQNIRGFIQLARRNPGKFTDASGGNGSVQHTAMESLKAAAGIDLLHVPYKGMAQATTDVVGGQVDSADPEWSPSSFSPRSDRCG